MQNRKSTGILALSRGDDLHTSPTQCWAPVSPASAVAPQAPSLSLTAFASTDFYSSSGVGERNCQLVAGLRPSLMGSSTS